MKQWITDNTAPPHEDNPPRTPPRRGLTITISVRIPEELRYKEAT